MHFLLLNGPNLNLLGSREPEVYGAHTLDDVEQNLGIICQQEGVELSCFQSNAEHAIIDKLHASQGLISGIVFNPGAFTHTSIAIRDALLGVNIPFIEVHISNVHQRESFRHHSYFSDIAVGTIVGLGVQGYDFALSALLAKLKVN